MMTLLSDENIRKLFSGILFCFLCGTVLMSVFGGNAAGVRIAVMLLTCSAVFCCLLLYFRGLQSRISGADEVIRRFLAGEQEARIDCEREGSLHRLFHEINAMAASLSAQADNEKRVQLFLRDMLSDISHQLKTPLAALNIYNGILAQETADQPDLKQFVDLSETELDRIDRLVQNLLKLAKLESGTIFFEKQPENLAEIFRDVKAHFVWREEQEGKTIRLSGPDELIYPCSRLWMTEAIENLCRNALDHTREGDTIDLRWEKTALGVKLSVADTGTGIHPEDLYHIFKRFYRSRFSKDSSGAGLGLPLTRMIIEEHGGTIEAESELGKGTLFTVWLPFPSKL